VNASTTGLDIKKSDKGPGNPYSSPCAAQMGIREGWYWIRGFVDLRNSATAVGAKTKTM